MSEPQESASQRCNRQFQDLLTSNKCTFVVHRIAVVVNRQQVFDDQIEFVEVPEDTQVKKPAPMRPPANPKAKRKR